MLRKIGDPKSMEFLKSLLLVILVPLVVSSLSFASRYGAQEATYEELVKNQSTMIAEIREERDLNNVMRSQVSANKEILSTNSRTLSEMSIFVAQIKTQVDTNTNVLSSNSDTLSSVSHTVAGIDATVGTLTGTTIPNSSLRIGRLEDMLFNMKKEP